MMINQNKKRGKQPVNVPIRNNNAIKNVPLLFIVYFTMKSRFILKIPDERNGIMIVFVVAE